MVWFEIPETKEYAGIYEVDLCVTHEAFEEVFISLAFNKKGEYLASYKDNYIGLFKDREDAIRELFTHIALESLNREICLKRIMEIAKTNEK